MAIENRPSACGLDARADRVAKAAAAAEAAMGYGGRGQRAHEATAKAAEPDTYSWENEVNEEDEGDKVPSSSWYFKPSVLVVDGFGYDSV